MTRLELELVFAPDGHLRDEALVALGDGQTEIVPSEALSHLEGCSTCEARLAEQALWSLEAHAALELVAAERASARFPWLVVALAAAVALAGLVPALPEVMALPALLTHGLPVLLKALGAALRHAPSDTSLLGVWVAVTIMATLLAVVLSRIAPRRIAWRGTDR